eukprot:296971-Chlamydomonas_euryale.AAC.1
MLAKRLPSLNLRRDAGLQEARLRSCKRRGVQAWVSAATQRAYVDGTRQPVEGTLQLVEGTLELAESALQRAQATREMSEGALLWQTLRPRSVLVPNKIVNCRTH